MSTKFDIGIVGSGFAGSLLARLLVRAGRSVVLIEAAQHPRFALGESSTPLAAMALERMAHRYGLPELSAFASHGRWQQVQPDLGCGLKRGFSFYGHSSGQPYSNDDCNSRRLLVAASPSNALADVHWLRADVDARFAQRAEEDGVTLLQRHRLIAATQVQQGLALQIESAKGQRQIDVDFAVDASAGALADALGIGSTPTCEAPSTLVYGHFRGVSPFAQGYPQFSAAPYPEFAAANHHLYADGWTYLLPFDSGVVSAGAVIESAAVADDPSLAWQQALARTPSLAACFHSATALPEVPVTVRRFQRRRRDQAAGRRWAMLPHGYAFSDPMFSTGIAWSLLAVERLTETLSLASVENDSIQEQLHRYAALLRTEADHISALCAGARRYYGDFDRFVEWARLYFVAASYCEARQRLLNPPQACWEGFLGSTDDLLGGLYHRAAERFGFDLQTIRRRLSDELRDRDFGGFLAADQRRSMDVDIEALLQAAPKLGLSSDWIRQRLPALLSGSWPL